MTKKFSSLKFVIENTFCCNANLLVKLDETTRLVETLVMENTSLDEKVNNFKVELSQARTKIERMSNAKFNEVLSAQKPSSNKTSLGYVVFCGIYL